jgi:hypothetical protein
MANRNEIEQECSVLALKGRNLSDGEFCNKLGLGAVFVCETVCDVDLETSVSCDGAWLN